MKLLLLSALCFASASADSTLSLRRMLASDSATCLNPLVATINTGSSNPYASITWPDASVTPSPFPSGISICKHLSGKSTCCSADLLQQLQAVENTLLDGIKSMKQQLDDVTSNYEQQVITLAPQICAAFAAQGLDEGKCESIVKAHASDLAGTLITMSRDAMKCVEAVALYEFGMVCLACDADWPTYVTNDSVKLAQNTCHVFANNCIAPVQDIIPVMKAYVSFVDDLLVAAGVPSQEDAINAKINTLPDGCGGTFGSPASSSDCEKYLCDNYLVGMGLALPTIPSAPTINSAVITDNIHPEAHLSWFLESITSLSQDKPVPLPPLHRQLAGAGTTFKNQYTSDGYDAIGNACNENSSLDACNSSFPLWAIVACIVGGLALIAVITIVVIRRHRASQPPSGVPYNSM